MISGLSIRPHEARLCDHLSNLVLFTDKQTKWRKQLGTDGPTKRRKRLSAIRS